MVLTFETVDDIHWCYHSNETSLVVLSHGTIYFSVQFYLLSLWMKSYGVTIQMKPLQQYFHMVLFIQYVVLTFESVDEILWCFHSNETSLAVLSHGTVCFSAFHKMKFGNFVKLGLLFVQFWE